MMKISRLIVFCGFLFVLVSGCASKGKNLVVLIPDPDGNVGEIQVTNAKGTQVMTEAEQAIYIKDRHTAPEPPTSIDEAEIQKIFGDVLAAEPQPPEKFILYFQANTIQLTDQALSLIPEILSTITTRNSQDIRVIGYTDTLGPKQVNFQFALNRALKIRDILIAEGVPPSTIEIDAYGEALPFIKTEDNVAEPRNRRVEVTIR